MDKKLNGEQWNFMGIFYNCIYADDELIHCDEPYIDKSFNLTMET